MHCTPSARLEATIPDSTSDYAKEGKLAHAIAELKVRKKFIEPMSQRTFNTRHNKLKKDPLYQPEMESCTDEYLDYITETALSYATRPYITAERKLDFSRYVPQGFGTGDCLIIGEDTLHVIDFKYGQGVVVDVENNPQLMLYGLGALEAYRVLYTIKHIALTIIQPRAQGDTVKEWNIEAEDLINWGAFTIRPLAERADKGEGDFVPGDWCRFCRAKSQCRARATSNLALEAFSGKDAPSKVDSGEFPKPPLLTDDEIGEVLIRATDIEKWATDLKEYALSAVLSGKPITGWKAVEGRSSRKFDDISAAFADIEKAGIDDAMLYERRPLTLAALEKAIGKSKFAEIAGTHIITPPGKPTLVPESDRRTAITNKQTAAEVFGADKE
jgi:hypothetical protein